MYHIIRTYYDSHNIYILNIYTYYRYEIQNIVRRWLYLINEGKVIMTNSALIQKIVCRDYYPRHRDSFAYFLVMYHSARLQYPSKVHNYRISAKLPLVRSTITTSRRMSSAPSKRVKTVTAAAGIVVKEVPTTPIEGQKTGTSGLRKRRQYFLRAITWQIGCRLYFMPFQAMKSKEALWYSEETGVGLTKRPLRSSSSLPREME